MVKAALAPPTGASKVRLVAGLGAVVRTVLLFVVIANAPSGPGAGLEICRWNPPLSLITVALTPQPFVVLRVLIESAKVLRVSLLPAVMGMSAVVPLGPPICNCRSPEVWPADKMEL